jgi:hypothetical protein
MVLPTFKSKILCALDKNPNEGVNSYRLRVDYEDGSFEYSNRDTVLFEPESDFTLYPNPASDYLNIYWKRFLRREVNLLITNVLGQVVYQRQFDEVQDKIFTLDLDRGTFKDGMYQVSVVHKGRAQTKRLVVASGR